MCEEIIKCVCLERDIRSGFHAYIGYSFFSQWVVNKTVMFTFAKTKLLRQQHIKLLRKLNKKWRQLIYLIR